MAQEVREFAVLVPHGTAIAAPVTVSIAFPERVVVRVSWRVPPGPSGKMGWQLTSAGTPVIPIQRGAYVVTDNQAGTWDLEGYLDSGNWAVTAYNTGVYDHTVYLTFELDLPGSGAPPAQPPTGVAVGVIGTGGIVPTPPPTGGGGTGSSPPSDDTVPSVTSVVLAAVLEQLLAGASQ